MEEIMMGTAEVLISVELIKDLLTTGNTLNKTTVTKGLPSEAELMLAKVGNDGRLHLLFKVDKPGHEVIDIHVKQAR